MSRTETITSSFYAPILPFVYDDIKIRTACGTLSYLIIVKNGLQGIFYIEDKEIVLEPKINEEYYLYTDTIGENAIGFSTKQGGGSMALWTLTGIFYLLLIAFLFLKVKK